MEWGEDGWLKGEGGGCREGGGEPDGGQCRAGVGRDWWGDISKIEY